LPFSSFCGVEWGTNYSSDTLVTPNYATSPLGDQTACRLQAFDGYNAWFGGAEAHGLGGTQPATFSIWLKSNTEDIQNIPVSLGDLDTYVRTKQFCLVTTAWQRCSVTTPANSSNVSPSIGDLYQTDWPWDISIWGAQVEASSSPGAYVSTADRPATATVGIATLTTAALFNGSHSLAASYSGDSNYNPSSSTALTHKVDQVKITNVYPLVNAQIGTPYSALLNAIGGSSPYSWTVALGGLPDGLLLGNDGTISGTPTGGPGGIFVARVTDSSDPDDTVTKMFEIDIASAPACLGHPIRRGDPCGNPPGISSVYPDEASAGATGQSVTVYGCYNTDENDSVGTLTINLPSNFTRTTGPVTTDRSVQELVNIASDAQLGTNQMSVHQSLDGCEWNTNQLPYYVTSPRFDIEYSSYIPVGHVEGPTGCFCGETWVFHKLYKGDANRGTYRTTESILVDPQVQRELSAIFKDTGFTDNYGFRSPVNGSTLSWLDEDDISDDCYLWNKRGKADPLGFIYDTSYPFPNQAQIHYSGSSSNPLEDSLATITWDMRTVLDNSNPAGPTAYVNFNHTCYPAHQVKVNGQVVYLYPPPADDISYIFDCLVIQDNKISGQTQAKPVPVQ